MKHLGLEVVALEECPKDTMYVLTPGTASTLAQHPALAEHLAKGNRVLVHNTQQGPSVEQVEEVRKAVRGAARIDGSFSADEGSHNPE